MSQVKRIGRNIGVYLSAQLVGGVLNFIFVMSAARYLGAQAFGTFSFACALSFLFSIFTDLGLRQLVTRDVARDGATLGRYVNSIMGIKVYLTGIVAASLFLFTYFMPYPEITKKVVYAIGISVVLDAFSGVFYGLFQACEKLEYESYALVVRNLLLLACVWFVTTLHLSVIAVAVIYSSVSAVVLVYSCLVYLKKFGGFKIDLDRRFGMRLLREAVPYGLIGMFTVLYRWVDTVILSTISGEAAAGMYNVAFRFFLILLLVPAAFDMAVFPVMSRLFISSKASLASVCEKTATYLILIGVPVCMATLLFAERLTVFFFGAEYRASATPLRFLVWSAMFIYAGTAFSSLLNSINRQMSLAKIILVCAILDILMNLLLIPRFSYVGAGISSVVSVFFMLAAILNTVLRRGYAVRTGRIAYRLCMSIIISLVIMLPWTFRQNTNLVLLAAVFPFLYLGLLFLSKGVDSEDMELLRQLRPSADR